MRIWQQIIVLCVIGGAGYWGYSYYRGEQAAPAVDTAPGAPIPLSVEVAPAEETVLRETVEAVGTTRARQSIEIVPEAAGRVAELNFTAGDQVARGDVLVRLDDAIEQADLLEAQAQLTEQRQILARVDQLRRSNAVAQASQEEAIARVAEATAAMERAKRHLENRTIRAPFDGVVGLRDIDSGAWLNAGKMITRLDDLSEIEVEFSLPETLFDRIVPGQMIQAGSAAFPDRTFEGEILNKGTRIDPVSRAFRVRAVIPNPDGALPAGMFMSITLILDESMHLVVPEEAILFQAANTYVFEVTGDTAHKRPVTTGRRQDGIIAISEGLQPGALVVVRGLQRIRDQSPVTVLNADTLPVLIGDES